MWLAPLNFNYYSYCLFYDVLGLIKVSKNIDLKFMENSNLIFSENNSRPGIIYRATELLHSPLPLIGLINKND
jgi:hypothetical protein